jgi:hypothetical protein
VNLLLACDEKSRVLTTRHEGVIDNTVVAEGMAASCEVCAVEMNISARDNLSGEYLIAG